MKDTFDGRKNMAGRSLALSTLPVEIDFDTYFRRDKKYEIA